MQSAKGIRQQHIWQTHGRHFLVPSLLVLTLLAPSWRANAAGTDGVADIPVADANLFERLDVDGDGTLTANEVATDQRRLFERLLRLGDENDDQALDESEWQTAIEPRRPPKPIEEKRSANLPGADAVRLLLLKLDTDRNAMLTSKEVTKDWRPLFDQIVSQLDRNDDGRINRQELARGGPQLARLAERAVRRFDIDVEQELKRLDRQQGSAAHRFDAEPTPENLLSDPKQALALFEQFDANNDGKLVLAEVPEQARDRFRFLFRTADRDRDQQLTKREFLAASKRMSDRLRDSSANPKGNPKGTGAKSTSPSPSAKESKPDASGESAKSIALANQLVDRMIKRLDRNKDGQISRGEAKGRLAERFSRADRNGDGLLDKGEIADLRAALAEKLDGKNQRD